MAHMHFFSDFPRLLGNEGTAAVPGAALEEEVEIWVFSLLVLKQLEDIKVKMSDKRLCMWIRISEKKKRFGLMSRTWKSLPYGYNYNHNYM